MYNRTLSKEESIKYLRDREVVGSYGYVKGVHFLPRDLKQALNDLLDYSLLAKRLDAECDQLVEERDKALEERDKALKEKNTALEQLNKLRADNQRAASFANIGNKRARRLGASLGLHAPWGS